MVLKFVTLSIIINTMKSIRTVQIILNMLELSCDCPCIIGILFVTSIVLKRKKDANLTRNHTAIQSSY